MYTFLKSINNSTVAQTNFFDVAEVHTHTTVVEEPQKPKDEPAEIAAAMIAQFLCPYCGPPYPYGCCC